MLENLDHTNWETLNNYDDNAKSIPDYIREIANEDLTNLSSLLGLGGNYPDPDPLWEATPLIIPFLLEIANKIANRKIRYALVWSFRQLLDSCIQTLSTHSSRTKDNVKELEIAAKTYQELGKGINVLKDILRSDIEWEDKIETVRILSNLVSYAENMADFFCEAIVEETDYRIIAALLHYFGKSFPQCRSKEGIYPNQKIYVDYLSNLAETSKNEVVRVSSSLAAVDIACKAKGFGSMLLPQSVIDVLYKELNRLLNRGNYLPVYHIPAYSKSYIIQYVVAASQSELIFFLQSNIVTVIDTFLIIREMLEAKFNRVCRLENFYALDVWAYSPSLEHWPANTSPPKSIIYQQGGQIFGKRTFSDEQKQLLNFIVECGDFWELPSNLLSFFYGLPNNRDELRKLISES